MDWVPKLPATSPSAPAKLQHGLGSKQFSLFLASHPQSGPGAIEPHPHGLQVWPANQNGVTPTTLAKNGWMSIGFFFPCSSEIQEKQNQTSNVPQLSNCPALPSVFQRVPPVFQHFQVPKSPSPDLGAGSPPCSAANSNGAPK